ncbi:MAG: signal peptidase I [Parcubacteria group bacterium]|nr:MAG: signal peptidase I [Parcubacteria group bacterium]
MSDKDLDLDKFDAGQVASDNWAKKLGLLVFEVVKVVLISLAIIVPIRLFLVQPFYVEGASMEPNFHDKEYLIINEISYRFDQPQRGEVVIFKSPADDRVYYIKRIIGLPGEEVEVRSGHIYVNGQELKETYVAKFSNDNIAAITLKASEYYVLGDNRTNSHDSRKFGAINKDRIIGKVWFRGWPADRISTFNLPSY